MKGLRKIVDQIKPTFEKGGKLEMFHSTFEAFETFLFVPNKVTAKGAHIRDAMDMKRAMIVVVMATIPALLLGMYNVGYLHFTSIGESAAFFEMFNYGLLKILPIIVVSYVVGLGIEFAFAQSRGHEVNEGFLVSGMLIPLIVPVTIPLWMVAVATAFAVVIGKEVFGGTGMNILNPALTARAFIFFAYPGQISGDYVWIAEKADAFSGATPLANAAAGNIEALPSVMEMVIGTIPGSIGETSFIAIILGGLILAYSGIASVRIMLSVFVGGLLMGGIMNAFAINDFMELEAYKHLLIGGFAFGAIFMATDPVSASQTATGKIIYGLLIGILTVLVRVLNPAYPEGMMLAILFMNVFAPLIDHYVVESNIKKRLKRASVKAE